MTWRNEANRDLIGLLREVVEVSLAASGPKDPRLLRALTDIGARERESRRALLARSQAVHRALELATLPQVGRVRI